MSSALDSCLYHTVSFIKGSQLHSFFSTFLQVILVYIFDRDMKGTHWLPFINENSAISHENRASVDVHVQFELHFEHFQYLDPIILVTGIKRNEIPSSIAMPSPPPPPPHIHPTINKHDLT